MNYREIHAFTKKRTFKQESDTNASTMFHTVRGSSISPVVIHTKPFKLPRGTH